MIVGIDLGTSYSSVAALINGRAVVIADEQGRTSHPSIIAFPPEGAVLAGHAARARLVVDPLHTIYSAKRLIGRRSDDPDVRAFHFAYPFRVAEGPNKNPVIEIRDRHYAIPEISAYVLRHLKKIAERALGVDIERAVVTVPANFNDAQREATRIAGRIAGLEVVRIINEPTAAALAYGYGRGLHRKVAIYDFGGGTFDVTLLEVTDRVFRVITTAGDMMLGGDDFDQALADHVHEAFWRKTKIELRHDMVEWQRLLFASEACKRELSQKREAELRVPRVAHIGGGAVDLAARVTRDIFNGLTIELARRSLAVCDRALADARLSAGDIDDVVLVGGSTHVPLVRAVVEQYFRQKPRTDVDPETAVAVGAAIHAATLMGAPLPDQQAAALLLDVLPHSIGIAAAGGFTERVIDRGTAVPVEQTRVFATGRDGQEEVRIVVVQGESRYTRENTPLGELVVGGIRRASRGEVEIEVCFEVDQSGILNLTARDRDSGRTHAKKIKLSGELTEAQIRDAQRSQEQH